MEYRCIDYKFLQPILGFFNILSIALLGLMLQRGFNKKPLTYIVQEMSKKVGKCRIFFLLCTISNILINLGLSKKQFFVL